MYIHIVELGETLFDIAKLYNTSEERIIIDNGLEINSTLVPGQALIILIPKTVYTILPGDTLDSIANKFGTTSIKLLQNNPFLSDEFFITAGQTIVIDFAQNKIRQLTVNGYAYPNINRSVLTRALPYLTYLTIFGYGFTEDGNLIPADDLALIDLSYKFNTAPVMLLSSIDQSGNFSSEKASLLFNNIPLQNTVIENIIRTMNAKGYVGLDIDFEFINPNDKNAFNHFVQNATERLNQAGYFVNTDLAPKTSETQRGLLYEAHDYKTIGRVSNTVLLMTYEWGYTYSPPMAVAPIDKVRQVAEYALTEIPPYKIMLGIPNYGYNWTLPFIEGQSRAETIGNQYAVNLATRYNTSINFDETAQSPYFNYTDQFSRQHTVWFEDVRSIKSKLQLSDELNLLGVGYWNIMRPFAQNWALLNVLYDIKKIV